MRRTKVSTVWREIRIRPAISSEVKPLVMNSSAVDCHPLQKRRKSRMKTVDDVAGCVRGPASERVGSVLVCAIAANRLNGMIQQRVLGFWELVDSVSRDHPTSSSSTALDW